MEGFPCFYQKVRLFISLQEWKRIKRRQFAVHPEHCGKRKIKFLSLWKALKKSGHNLLTNYSQLILVTHWLAEGIVTRCSMLCTPTELINAPPGFSYGFPLQQKERSRPSYPLIPQCSNTWVKSWALRLGRVGSTCLLHILTSSSIKYNSFRN